MATTTLLCCCSRLPLRASSHRPHSHGFLQTRLVSVSRHQSLALTGSASISVLQFRVTGSQRGTRYCSAAAADPGPAPDSSSIPEETSVPAEEGNPKSFWQNWRTNASELRKKVSKWGLAAVLAYGLFDGITYTTFFILAFLSYEKSTGQNPAVNLKALLGVVLLMWGGNNVTRPFRVAGAAALAPFIDRGLKKMQDVLKLPNQAFAFMICVATFACACFSVVAVLILSRLGR